MIKDFIKFVNHLKLFSFENELMINDKYYSHNNAVQTALSITGKRKGLYSDVTLSQVYDQLNINSFLQYTKIDLTLEFKVSLEALHKLNSSLDHIRIQKNKLYFETFSELTLYLRSFNKTTELKKIKLTREKDLLAVITNTYRSTFEILNNIHGSKELEKIIKALRGVNLEDFDYSRTYRFFKEEEKALKEKKIRKLLYNFVSTAVEEGISYFEKLIIHDKLINESLLDSAKKELNEDELWRLKNISNYLNNNNSLLFFIFSKLIDPLTKASINFTSTKSIKGFDLLLNTVEGIFELVKDNKKLLFYVSFSIIEFINKNLKFLEANDIYIAKGSLLDFLDLLLDYVTKSSLSNDFKILNYIQELSLAKENLYKKANFSFLGIIGQKKVDELRGKNNDFLETNKFLKETASFELVVLTYGIIGYNIYKRYTLNSTPRYYNINNSSFTSFYTHSGTNSIASVVNVPNVLSLNKTRNPRDANIFNEKLELFFKLFESSDLKHTISVFADIELKKDFHNLVIKAKKYKEKWKDTKVILPNQVEENIKSIRAFKNLIIFVKKDFAEFLMKYTNVIIDCNNLSSFDNYSLAISKFFIKYVVPFNVTYNNGGIEITSFIFDAVSNKSVGGFSWYSFNYRPLENFIQILENPAGYSKPSLENIVEEQKTDLFINSTSMLSFIHDILLKF